MKCSNCTSEASSRLLKRGNGILKQKMSCNDCVEPLKRQMEDETASDERASGNPFYPEMNRMGWKPVEVLPL